MKICKCSTEIRDDQSICFNCFLKENNLRLISKDEIVLDCDDRENGDKILMMIAQFSFF
jgi:hypothetical protein